MKTAIQIIRRYFWPIIIIVAIVLLALTYEAGRQSVYRAHPELAQTEQVNAVLVKVGKLIQLPAGETPTMASVTDAASVKKAQPFLVNAQNGDILIVYATAGEALLYRPSTDKLIAVGPIDNTAPQTAPVIAPASNATTTSTSTKK